MAINNGRSNISVGYGNHLHKAGHEPLIIWLHVNSRLVIFSGGLLRTPEYLPMICTIINRSMFTKQNITNNYKNQYEPIIVLRKNKKPLLNDQFVTSFSPMPPTTSSQVVSTASSPTTWPPPPLGLASPSGDQQLLPIFVQPSSSWKHHSNQYDSVVLCRFTV